MGHFRRKLLKKMKSRKKMCAGAGREEHEDFIYKNIGGKKYCKACAFRISPPKKLRPMSKKQVFKIQLKKELLEEDKVFYYKVWKKRFFRQVGDAFVCIGIPRCENCRKDIGFTPNLTFFHHILEKRNYPALRHVEENIAIVCTECHNRYETFPDKVPYLVKRRDLLQYRYARNELTENLITS